MENRIVQDFVMYFLHWNKQIINVIIEIIGENIIMQKEIIEHIRNKGDLNLWTDKQ